MNVKEMIIYTVAHTAVGRKKRLGTQESVSYTFLKLRKKLTQKKGYSSFPSLDVSLFSC